MKDDRKESYGNDQRNRKSSEEQTVSGDKFTASNLREQLNRFWSKLQSKAAKVRKTILNR